MKEKVFFALIVTMISSSTIGKCGENCRSNCLEIAKQSEKVCDLKCSRQESISDR
jgi:transposase